MGQPCPKPEPRVKGHQAGCTCKPCIGKRAQRDGLKAQRRHLKALAEAEGTVRRFYSSFSNEETAGLRLFQVEVKQGLQVPRFFQRAFGQAERAIATGSGRKPLLLIEEPSGHSTLAVLYLEDLLDVVRAVTALGAER